MNGYGEISKSWVMRLLIINTIIFMLTILAERYRIPFQNQVLPLKTLLELLFGVVPLYIVKQYWAWQFVSYMFLHGNFLHLFLNMYALFLFGIPVEQVWGGRKFIFYYLFTGIGAGITIFIINLIIGGAAIYTPTIGASGAVFGLLLAFGMLFPEAEILIFFIIPMRAKFLVIIYGLIELYSLYQSGGQSSISHAGHLGGLLFGLVFFAFTRKRDIRFKSKVIKARIGKEISRKSVNSSMNHPNDAEALQRILAKLKSGGLNNLSDDEYQFIKLKMIMLHDSPDQCVEKDFNDDDYCKNCKDYEACLLKVISKYMQ